MARAKRSNGRSRPRKAKGGATRLVTHRAIEEFPADASGTAVAVEALRSGLLPSTWRRREVIPHETDTIRVGDPDDDVMANEYVGEDTPGGSTSTPDQSNVDEIGRAYGLQEEDAGELRSGGEVLARRDRRRPELRPPRRPRP
jgi:hypothetical protein